MSFQNAAWNDLEANAHKLAGVALVHGFHDLGALARELETFAGKENRRGVDEMIGRIRRIKGDFFS